MRRARPKPTTTSRPGLAPTSCSTQRTTTIYAGATTRESETRPWLASAPMAKPFTSATYGSPTIMRAPSITGGATTSGDKPAGRRTQSVPQLGGAVVAFGPHTPVPEVQAVRNQQVRRRQAAVFIVHFAALCVAEKDSAWLGLSSEDSPSQGLSALNFFSSFRKRSQLYRCHRTSS